MAAVAVQSIADDVTRWITAPSGNSSVVPVPHRLRRHSSGSVGAHVFVSYAAHADADFARAVVARLRLERQHLRVAVETEDERTAAAAAAAVCPKARICPQVRGSGPPTSAGLILVALSRETFECPLVLQELALCLSYAERGASVDEGVRIPKLAFVYNVRSGRGQDPSDMIRNRAPTWLQVGMEGLGSSAPEPLLRSSAAVPIFEYLHEYDDLCVSAVLKWLDSLDSVDNMPSPNTLQRLNSSVRNAANILRSPARSVRAGSPARILPPISRPGSGSRGSGRESVVASAGGMSDFTLNASAVKSAPRAMKSVAVGLLYEPSGPGKDIARDVAHACGCTFGAAVRTADVGGQSGVTLETVANLMVIVTPGAFRCEMIVEIVTKAVRSGGVNILLLQDVRTVPNIWDEFEALPATLRPSIVSIIAVPYLRSHGFSACLARLAGTELLRPVACAEGPTAKPAAAQYGRAATQKLFDLFLCHFQRTGLDWAFAMRLSFVQHAGVGFRTFLDVQSLQNVNECGRFVEQSHAIAVLITRGIFTRLFCQRELIFARKAGVQIIFIQHMRTCIDIEEELDLVRGQPSEFLASTYGMEYQRAGGTEASFTAFQQALFQQIWTPKFRPPVFAYIHELEASCVHEIVGYLRNRRAHRQIGIEQLDQAARALLDFLRMSPDDKSDVRAGLAALANQAAAGNGDEFCEAIVRVNALPAVSDSLRRHGSKDGGVVYQALRSLRTAAATRAGSAALVQFANADAALATLHEVIKSHADVETRRNGQLRREALAVLRAFRDGDATVQQALHRSGLKPEFDELFQRLRAELEPLDAIREQLNLDPVQLPKLEFALGHWRRKQSTSEQEETTSGSLPSEVAYANELLSNVRELREAVAQEDGERTDALLREHVKDVERCADVEALLREARRIAQEFQETLRLQKAKLQSEEELAKARRAAQDSLEDLLARAMESPEAEMMTELEEAIVRGHELKCSLGMLERARGLLDELRCIFESPSKFLEAPEKVASHTSPFSAVLAVLSYKSGDRNMVLRCLEVQTQLVEQESTAPPLVKRQDVDKLLRIIEKYVDDREMQVAAFECLTTFLRVARVRHGPISARALIQHPTSGDFTAVEVAVSALATQRRSALHKARGLDPEVLGAACKSLAEMARQGDHVAAFLKRIQGMSQLWYIIRELGQEGRQKHADTVVAFTIATFEEVGRHSGWERGFSAIVTLLKFCDIYDSEVSVCIPALRSICSLFSEKPEWTGLLVGTLAVPEDPTSPSGRRGTVDEDGFGVVLRSLRMHERQAEVQRLGYIIISTTVQRLLLDGASNCVLPSYLWCRAVQMAIVALRVHLLVAGTCEAVLCSLGSLVDFLPDLVCQEVVQADGVKPTVYSMDRHPSVGPVQQCGLKLMSRVTKRYPRQTLGEQNLRAIVQAMEARPNDSLTQLFGCAALRSISEQGLDSVTSVAKLAAPALFAALDACRGHVPLYGEAFRVLELIASANPELGRMLGEKYQAVLRILSSLPALLSEPDSPRDIDTNARKEDMSELTAEVCHIGCGTLRALCRARAVAEVSYDRLFHRGVCTASATLAELLSAFPRNHDLQLEALQLLHEAVTPDQDGAKLVGEVLARPEAHVPSEIGSNLVTSALVRFHTDSDCVVIFGLLSKLCVCESFVASFMAVSGSMAEVLRWTGIFRDDRLVQTTAVDLVDALLQSSTFDPQILIDAEGLEALMLATARHDDCSLGTTAAPNATVTLASRVTPEVFHQAMKTIIERHESNAKVIGAACSILTAVFQADNQGYTSLRRSGAMEALLRGILKHQSERIVTNKVPQLVEVTLLDSAMRKLFLSYRVQDLLMQVLQQNFRSEPRRGSPEWLRAVNGAARRAERTIELLDVQAAGFRALQRLFCMDEWRAVVTPDLIEILMRTLAVTDSRPLMADAIAILKKILQISESQMTWMACTETDTNSQQTKAEKVLQIAHTARAAHDAETRAIKAWRAGNFMPAAGDFRAAKTGYEALAKMAPKRLQKALSEHLKNMPLEQYAQMCEEQQGFMHSATEAPRTVEDVSFSYSHLNSEDCPICFDKLAVEGKLDLAKLWQCKQCEKWMHLACIQQWGQRSRTCPLCRKEHSSSSTDAKPDAYHRAKAVAMAAEARAQPLARNSTNRVGTAFLATSISLLWRVASRLGVAIGIDPVLTEEDSRHAADLERAGQEACTNVLHESEKFEKGFVQLCEVEANETGVSDLEITSNVMEAMAVEILQRRCAHLAEEAHMWETDVRRLQDQSRYDHAEQLSALIIAQLTEVTQMAQAAALSDRELRKHLQDLQGLRSDLQDSQNSRGAVRSEGDVSTQHRPRASLTPFANCFARTWEYGPLSLHGLAAVRAIAAAARASRVVAGRELQGPRKVMMLTRRISSACEHLVKAILQDRAHVQVSGFITGGSDKRRHALLSISFFQQFQYCGPEARTACFMQLDQIVSALASARLRQDDQLRACLCSLVRDLVFGGGNEDRMVHRLQREGSPRMAWSLEEWYLDTLLVQNNAQAYRASILQASNADAWLCCSGLGVGSDEDDILSGNGNSSQIP